MIIINEKNPVYLPSDLNNQIGEAYEVKNKNSITTNINWNICEKIYNPSINNNIYYTLLDNKHIHRYFKNDDGEFGEECINN
jgi:hypothetical protein